MTVMQALILGIIQGLTEFLPISSSGHLVFVPKLLGWADQGLSFDVVVHVGSLLAVIVYFRRRLWTLTKGLFGSNKATKKERKLAWYILLTIIPAGIVGFLFGDWIELNLRSTRLIAFGLIFWGVMLGFVDTVSSRIKKKKTLDETSWQTSLFIGLAQAIALIPGTSRSGITMTAGLAGKMSKESAAEFSFLMSVPIIALAGALKITELIKVGLEGFSITTLSVGFAASAVSGFLAIKLLLGIVRRWNFMPFVFYRIIIGLLILIYV